MSVSHQVQSVTPKRNAYDELKRMQQAYAIIRNFDVRPIEMKIRQVRLNRLLSHIKESLSDLATENQSENKLKKEKMPSDAEIRQEQIVRARKLGQEYSKLNSFLPRTLPRPSYVKSKKAPQCSLRKRIEYGNSVSNAQREKVDKIPTKVVKRKVTKSQSKFSAMEARPHQNTMADSDDMETIRSNETKPVHYLNEMLKLNSLNSDRSETKKEPQSSSSYLENVLKSKDVTYWDIVSTIQREQMRAHRVGEFMTRLSNVPLQEMPADVEVSESTSECFETRTSFIPTQRLPSSSEVLVREYRYSIQDNDINEISEKKKALSLKAQENEFVNEQSMILNNPEATITEKIKETNDRFAEIQNVFQHVDG